MNIFGRLSETIIVMERGHQELCEMKNSYGILVFLFRVVLFPFLVGDYILRVTGLLAPLPPEMKDASVEDLVLKKLVEYTIRYNHVFIETNGQVLLGENCEVGPRLHSHYLNYICNHLLKSMYIEAPRPGRIWTINFDVGGKYAISFYLVPENEEVSIP